MKFANSDQRSIFFNRPILIPFDFFFQLPAFASVPSSAARALREMLHVLGADAAGRQAYPEGDRGFGCDVPAALALAFEKILQAPREGLEGPTCTISCMIKLLHGFSVDLHLRS